MTPPSRPPLFMMLFFSLFGFMGITILIFLWTASGFGAPPLFARIFGSFIALGFIFMGFGVPLQALRAGKEPPSTASSSSSPTTEGNYECPNCGANVGDAEVSPSGDIRCQYCGGWWNIHRSA